MPKEWDDERLETLVREAVQERLEPAAASRREVRWQHLRRHIDSGLNRRQITIGPWTLSRLGLAACCLLVVATLLPLAFSDQLINIGQRWSTPVAIKEDSDKIAPEAAVELLERTPEPPPATGTELEKLDEGKRSAPEFDQIVAADTSSAEKPETLDGAEQPQAAAETATVAPGIHEDLTIDEVQRKVPFSVWLIRDLPSGFSLVNITFEAHGRETGKVIMFYDHPDGRYLRIEQEPLVKPVEKERSFADNSAEEIIIRGRAGQMLVRGEDWCDLRWVEEDTIIRMWGQLRPGEMKKVAESLFNISSSEEIQPELLRN
jgi:hypothetical protein